MMKRYNVNILNKSSVVALAEMLKSAGEDNVVRLSVLEIVKGTVSRDFGREMRNVVENIIENEHKRVIIDFAGVEMCSSAFVDELIGKLLEKYQFVKFMNLINLVGISGLNALLIDHSIRQRLGVAHVEERMVQ